MLCPKCGREVDDSAAICPGCDFILDTSFLGEDITDDESDKRVKKTRRAKPRAAAPSEDYGEDALILGDLADEIESFQSADTGFVQREATHARIYIGGLVHQMLAPDSIPAIAPGLSQESMRLTPFERHVLEYVNGKRPVARIKKKAGLDDNELRTALATLADKGFLRLAGKARRRGTGEVTRLADLSVADATVVSALPSALEEEDRRPAPSDDEGVFAESTEQSRLLSDQPEPLADIHREVTLIQKAPSPSMGGKSAEERALSYADSLLSEEAPGALSSPPEERRRSVEARPKRSRRRPPLPGEVEPAPPTGPVSLAPPTGPVDVPALQARGELPADEEEGARFEDGALTGAEHPRGSLEEFPSAFPTQPPAEPVSDFSVSVPAEPVSDFSEVDADLIEPVSDFSDTDGDPPAATPPVTPPVPPPSSAPLPLAARIEVSEPVPVRPDEISLKIVITPPESPPPAAPPPASPGLPPLPGQGVPPVVSVPGLPGQGVPPLPGQGVPPLPGQGGGAVRPAAKPVAVPAVPGPPAVPPAVPGPPPAALDDDDVEHDSDEGEPVLAAGGVSFEMRRKAEKIFEQAERDIAEGRRSSALMNAKLAAIYNPQEARYQAALEEWEGMKSGRVARRSVPQSLLEQAQQAEARGQYERAVELLKQAIELDPNAAALHNRLGVLLATRLKRYNEASAHVMRAIELNPQSPAYKNNLGKILAKEDTELEKQGTQTRKSKKKQDDGAIIVKKLRPKLF